MKNILVTGGAGYIGSHTVKELQRKGYNPIVLDNLTEGHREAVSAPLIHADIADSEAVAKALTEHSIDAVMHFSAYINVGESVTNPEKYYKNNVLATSNLLSCMLRHDVKKFIFSSTCAVYGNPVYSPLDEKHPQNPINPYGETKLMIEKILRDYSAAYRLQYASLRYFNAAGAMPDSSIGESHRVETHLIPLILRTLTGEKENIKIFGTDYDTPDGTCVRDYIHVCDLADAHIKALEKLDAEEGFSFAANLGTGFGNSVKEIIKSCERVTGKKVPAVVSGRRAGDPPFLVAKGDYARELLNFTPRYTCVDDIIKTAWDWERNKKFK